MLHRASGTVESLMIEAIKNLLKKQATGENQPFRTGVPAPYGQEHVDFMYNLLFCDDPSLFRSAEDQRGPWQLVLSRESNPSAVRRLAEDESEESRLRCLAFNWLRKIGHPVPSGRLLGAIVEIGLDPGLDTIAVFGDGRLRYINHTGKMTVFESTPPDVATAVWELLAASQPVVDRIGPSDKPRCPPPPKGSMRMTFLVSDGLYFGEGPITVMERDPLGGPVYQAAGRVLQAVLAAAT
jgi:hypothetical protein